MNDLPRPYIENPNLAWNQDANGMKIPYANEIIEEYIF